MAVVVHSMMRYLWRLAGEFIPLACKGNAGAILPPRLHIDGENLLQAMELHKSHNTV
jgi:hypothetical protein